MSASLELKRDVEAVQIPSGDQVHLPIGTKVIITQSLGGTYTVATDFGLARISEKDADALGIDPEASKKEEAGSSSNVPEDANDIEQAVWSDLGLVYDCRVVDTESGSRKAEVKMTLTAPGCGMGPTIAADAQSRILTIEDIDDASVDVVWDPPWNQDMISIEGKMKLGML